MKSIQKIAVVFLLIIVMLSVFGFKVGYYDNFPLCYDEKGEPKGLFVDILERALGRDFSKVRFIFGEFSDLMNQLKEGKIDILMAIAETKERQEVYSFNEEPVIMNWGVLVSSVQFGDLNQINGKYVAVNNGDIYYQKFKELLQSFGINAEFIEFDTYYDVLNKVNEGEFKYGVVSRLSYLANSEKFRNVSQTSYIFSPVSLKFATKKGSNLDILDKIDKQLMILKSSGELNEMFNSYFVKSKFRMPNFYFSFSVIVIISLFVLFLITLYFLAWKLRKVNVLYRSALEKLNFNNEEASENGKKNLVYNKKIGMELLKKYIELSKREEHALSVLAVEFDNVKEENRKDIEEILLTMVRTGDFIFRNNNRSYFIVMYSYGAFVIGSFRKNLIDKLKKANIDINISLGLKIFNPKTDVDIERLLLDTLIELEKDKEFRR